MLRSRNMSGAFRDFFAGKTILITGLGFLGNYLVRKLLLDFCCARIFVLIRAKSSRSFDDRKVKFLQDLSDCPNIEKVCLNQLYLLSSNKFISLIMI